MLNGESISQKAKNLLEEIFDEDDISSVSCTDISKVDVALVLHIVNDGEVTFFHVFPFDWQHLKLWSNKNVLDLW